MRALVYHGPGDLRVETDLPEPQCGPHQVKVRPAFCGICGTDLHEFSTQTFFPSRDHPHAVTGESVPMPMGHEFSGEIVELGSALLESGQSSLRVGDRVAVEPTVHCGACPACRDGLPNNCASAGFIGLSGWGGGMSDLVCADARFVFRLPDNVGLDAGAVVEPLAIAWHAVELSGVRPGDSVLVMGAGPIGLSAIQCLRAHGAGQVIAVEVAAARQEFARKLGATAVIDPLKEDVVARCKELCSGGGPQLAFDCAGNPKTMEAAVRSVRHRGKVVNVAIWEKEAPFLFNNLVWGEKSVIGTTGYLHEDYEAVIKALSDGTLDAQAMITSKVRLDRVPEDGFAALINHKDQHVKILVDCRAQ